MKSPLVFLLLLNVVGCSREDKELEKKSPVQLLTQTEWILTGHGFDDNKNKLIDAAENMAAECQKDNTYLFRVNGSGTNFENDNQCGTTNPENNFTWKLTANDTKLNIDHLSVGIILLDEHNLIISPYDSISFPLKDFLISFKR